MSIGKVKYIEREVRWVLGSVYYKKEPSYSWFTLLPGKCNDMCYTYGYLPRRFNIVGSILK